MTRIKRIEKIEKEINEKMATIESILNSQSYEHSEDIEEDEKDGEITDILFELASELTEHFGFDDYDYTYYATGQRLDTSITMTNKKTTFILHLFAERHRNFDIYNYGIGNNHMEIKHK